MQARARALRGRLQGTEDASLVERLAEIDEEYVERGAEDITEVDLDTVVERAAAIADRFRSNGPLQRLLDDGRLLLGLVRDVRHGRYREVPVWTLSAAAFALLYVLNPLDLVPDAVPLLGLIDDAAVISACLSLVEQDLHDYRTWRQAQLPKGGPDEASEQNLTSS
jgi:uncharacterized membrane protein YkvA (DUF1232 family)